MNERWLYALVAVAVGVTAGAMASWLLGRALQSPRRRRELNHIADPASAFVFWFITAAGIVIALGFAAPGSMDEVPAQVLSYLPRVLVAGLVLIAGYALALACAAILGPGLARGTGRSRRQATTAIRSAFMAAAALLALSQLGIQTTILTIAVAALLFGTAAAMALLIGLGGKDLARDIAVGRYVRRIVQPGDEVEIGEVKGEVAAIHPATLELEASESGRIHVPYSKILAGTLRVRRREAAEAAEEHITPRDVQRGKAPPESQPRVRERSM